MLALVRWSYYAQRYDSTKAFRFSLFDGWPSSFTNSGTLLLTWHGVNYEVWLKRPPRGGPQWRNHATFFAFSRIHAINEKLGFSRKNTEIGRKTCFSRNHACFWMISRNHAHFSTFSRITHASRFTQSRRNKIVFTQSRRKIRPITQSRTLWAGLVNILAKKHLRNILI